MVLGYYTVNTQLHSYTQVEELSTPWMVQASGSARCWGGLVVHIQVRETKQCRRCGSFRGDQTGCSLTIRGVLVTNGRTPTRGPSNGVSTALGQTFN